MASRLIPAGPGTGLRNGHAGRARFDAKSRFEPVGEWARIPGGNKPGVVWVICTEFPGSRACPQIEAKPNGVDEPAGNGILIRLLGS